jgi:hypothetical protein
VTRLRNITCKLHALSHCHHNSSPFTSISVSQVKELSAVLARFYASRPNEQSKTKELVKPGEDPEEDPVDDNQMPAGILTDFSIFVHHNGMVLLAPIEEDDGVDRPFEALTLVGSLRISDVDKKIEKRRRKRRRCTFGPGAILRLTLNYRSDYE